MVDFVSGAPRQRLWLCVGALLAIGGLAVGVRGATQEYVTDALYVSSARIKATGSKYDDTLFDVDMVYDCVEDSSRNCGRTIGWSPPYAVWYWRDYWKLYVDPASCLGLNGPLGPLGPLGTMGPVGSNTWNPSDVISGNHSDWATAMWQLIEQWQDSDADPLSYNGPLGSKGPVTTPAVYNQMYHLNEMYNAQAYPINLDITGVWGALGPLSVLGAMGMLGPVGPVGATGYTTKDADGNWDGQYRDTQTGEIQRTYSVPYDSSRDTDYRVFELFEYYPKPTADALGEDNDCSWMVESEITSSRDAETYTFTSQFTQFVTVLIVPVETNKNAYLSLSTKGPADASFSAVDSVSEDDYANFLIVRAVPGQVFQATVTAGEDVKYRILVSPSGYLRGPEGKEADADDFNHWNIDGPHQDTY